MLHTNGLDIVAQELEKQLAENAILIQRIQDLELRIIKAEDKLKKIEDIFKSEVL